MLDGGLPTVKTGAHFLLQDCCNQLQLECLLAATCAIAAYFQSADEDVELTIALNLSLQAVEQVTFEFHDPATPQACHVDVVTLWAPLVVVLFPLHVHEIQLVHQAMPLQ